MCIFGRALQLRGPKRRSSEAPRCLASQESDVSAANSGRLSPQESDVSAASSGRSSPRRRLLVLCTPPRRPKLRAALAATRVQGPRRKQVLRVCLLIRGPGRRLFVCAAPAALRPLARACGQELAGIAALFERVVDLALVGRLGPDWPSRLLSPMSRAVRMSL